jgi:flavin reductase (DIM6/NTAB) family NADH-FMN oxidoreductase RutF
MYYDHRARAEDGAQARELPWNPFKALVGPRPIGWVGTAGPAGVVNLAPFSYFQAVADRPDVVVLSIASASVVDGDGFAVTDRRKDTELNLAPRGELVVNLASWDQREAINETSRHLPRDTSEVERAGLELAPSLRVAVPRVVGAPAALECEVVAVQPVPHRHGDHRFHLVFAEVVVSHIDDRFVTDEGRVDTAAMRLLTRLGYDEYAVLESVFRMPRPDLDPVAQGLVR